jgi:hypothetical protein
VKHSLRILVTGTATALLTTLSTAAPALAAGPAAARTGPLTVLHVGQIDRQDVPSSGGCEPDTLVEPDVAISPVNPKIQVAVAHDCRFAAGAAVDISYAWTHDGGAHWHHAPIPKLTTAVGGAWQAASDPVVAFGPDGSVYVSALVLGSGCTTGVTVSRSVDGGATFAPPVVVQKSTACSVSDDKDWLVIDAQPKSPFRGRLYQFWTEFLASGASPQVVRWSDDKGKHWSSTHFVSPRKQFAQDSQAFVQPGGTLIDVYLSAGHAIGNDLRKGGILGRGGHAAQSSGTSLVAQTSTDGGATWSHLSTVARNMGGGPAGIRCCLALATGDPATGRMFAVWNANGPGALDPVELSSSTNGQNWSHPVQVTPGHRPKVQYINAAVAASNGRVFVAYGRRNLATDHGNIIQQEVTWSPERGGTFARPITLGPPSNLKYAAVSRGKFPGDYSGLSATPDRVTSAWCVSSKPAKPGARYHQVLYAAVLKP